MKLICGCNRWCGTQYAVRSTQYAVRSTQYVVRSTQYVVHFDIRINSINKKRVLKQIIIKLHNRDVRILRRIQDYLHKGRIRVDKNKPYSPFLNGVSTKEIMLYIIKNINGLIRLKVLSFKEACSLYNIYSKKANYNVNLYN